MALFFHFSTKNPRTYHSSENKISTCIVIRQKITAHITTHNLIERNSLSNILKKGNKECVDDSFTPDCIKSTERHKSYVKYFSSQSSITNVSYPKYRYSTAETPQNQEKNALIYLSWIKKVVLLHADYYLAGQKPATSRINSCIRFIGQDVMVR